VTDRDTDGQAAFAVRFFLLSVTVFGVAALLAGVLIHFAPPAARAGRLPFPRVFWVSSLFHFFGSVALSRALGHVRVEKQEPFRRSLLAGLGAGILFVAVQSYGLWCLLQGQNAGEVATGASAFIFVFAVLHALHVGLAMLFLVFVTLRGFADRYDHEYFWGVTVCAYFWHFLGAVWLCILVVFAFAML